jgi:uncharacterized RDD family membrane protein YckC
VSDGDRIGSGVSEGEVGLAGVDAEVPSAVEGSGEPPLVYVGLVTRAIAIAVGALVVVSAAVVAGGVLLVFSVFAVTGNNHPLAILLGGVVFVVWVVSYFGSLWTTTGQTIGSRVMQIQVTTVDGGRMRPRHAMLRLVGMVISLPLFWGYVPVLVNQRRRGVPDVLSGTVVTEAPAHPEIEAGPSGSARVLPPAHAGCGDHRSGIEPTTTVPSPGAE